MNLKEIARKVRINIINQVADAASGHPGGSLSAAEILTLLYFEIMNIDSLDDPQRDRFVLSKGHASPLLYGIFAEKGFIDRSELRDFRKLGSRLQGHPDMKRLPGVEISTGSLGLGCSAAAGIALAGKTDGSSYKVYTLLGDGELQEGVVWEAFMAAAHYKLDNLTVIIDNNNLQIDGKVDEVMSVYPIKEKLESFGFNVCTADGHDFESLRSAFGAAKNTSGRPNAVIASTIKGKGVSFMQNNPGWHGKAPDSGQRAQALKELGGSDE